MTYATEKAVVGRKPHIVAEITLDLCSNLYGGGLLSPLDGTCTAAGASGSECYNTRATCQDVPNYTKTTKVYRFCQPRADMPKGINMYPVILGEPNFAPVGAPVYGVGDRGKVTLTLQDFPHNDLGVDPYVANRSYDPESQGTFFGKWIARNKYYIGRTFVIKNGFLTDPFSWDNYQDRTYVIEKIDGPDSNGRIKITGADFLQLTNDERAKVPVQTCGTYGGGLTDSPNVITIIGDCAEYGASGYVRIADEIYQFTGHTIPSPLTGTSTLTGVTRATWGSTQEDPSIGDTVQLCKSWTATNVVDTVYDLLVNHAGIDSTKIPYSQGSPQDEWDIEKEDWLSNNNLTTIISEPTGIKSLLEELCEENQFSLYVDQVNDKVKLVTNTPPALNEPYESLNDNAHLIQDSISIKRDTKRQYTRVSILYGMRDYTKGKDEQTNYRFGFIDPDLAAEGTDQYNLTKEKRVLSRWYDEANGAQVSQLAGRLKSRFVDPPVVVHFDLDAKDSSIWSGTLAELTTRHLQEADGADTVFKVQILTVDEMKDSLRYVAMSSQFKGVYAYVKPNASPKVDYSNETDDNKLKYAHVCPSTGFFDDGTPGYKII